MAFVRVEQRNAHLAGAVRLHTVEGRDGPVSMATLTAISNTRRGSGENRSEEATAIQWTLWPDRTARHNRRPPLCRIDRIWRAGPRPAR